MLIENVLKGLLQGAIAAYYAHNLSEAEKKAFYALEIYPDCGEALNLLGLVYDDLGKLDKAETYLRKAVLVASTEPSIRFNLGSVLRHQMRISDALHCYEEAISMEPGYAPLLFNYANLLASIGRTQEAADFYKKSLAIDPGDVDALNNLGILCWRMHRASDAIECFEKIIKLNSESPRVS
ncbi:MAG: hypothetical protein CGU28_00830 [Candidatus Dactylopiibacterium carminicum]|uniref:Uncharacterized protein n=1 Tax=Candidatus Dactylopiibacterium carminicum TaxID=857335 RepID=A0A272EVU5_9RHOO|nr:tetratricopeptide repeat protein [Candidatus Dactylopiibacterium carminicum]KAF7597667.1 hypothetical protein BGI27_17575 [Candidatus Dactylopiibacterium carminicum]PAS93545.1 MAG: hypothetical protein BSR46_17625 [Candidatus Dactylopiibacterium carminicum]PAS94227.1 MAG: hypothetical protein CGU29_04170 [Candidatus Dactylopiibacterium carminicum]PAS98424.1 MAG: hypothetical protein CGU28_00830 [Candidatus Dactylopiibacterium carminicum]